MEIFEEFGTVISFLNSWKIFGNISVWQVLLAVLIAGILFKLLKGKK